MLNFGGISRLLLKKYKNAGFDNSLSRFQGFFSALAEVNLNSYGCLVNSSYQK